MTFPFFQKIPIDLARENARADGTCTKVFLGWRPTSHGRSPPGAQLCKKSGKSIEPFSSAPKCTVLRQNGNFTRPRDCSVDFQWKITMLKHSDFSVDSLLRLRGGNAFRGIAEPKERVEVGISPERRTLGRTTSEGSLIESVRQIVPLC